MKRDLFDQEDDHLQIAADIWVAWKRRAVLPGLSRLWVFRDINATEARHVGVIEQGRCGRWRWIRDGALPGYWRGTLEMAIRSMLLFFGAKDQRQRANP